MHRFKRNQAYLRATTHLLMGVAMVFAPACGRQALAAGGSAGDVANQSGITGVVRDAQGVAQMGALVQVLGAGSRTIGTAFTDRHGRYQFANLAAGRYLVRASAALYVPATRANLELHTGAHAVVNLTLAALFDPTSWLPAERRRPEEPDDDWKWTLRSTATRPILRIVTNDDAEQVSSSAEHAPQPAALSARETVASGDGGFGRGGLHNIVEVHRVSGDGVSETVRADIGTRDPSARFGAGTQGSPTQFDAAIEQRGSFGGAMRSVVSYQAHPELLTTPGALNSGTTQAGIEVIEVTTAERFAIGDRLEVEAGGRLEGVHSTVYAIATRPFVRIAVHPGGAWTIQYRMATDREAQGFEDVTPEGEAVPVALIRDGRLALESGRHQEISATHKNARAAVSVSLYHDGAGQAVVAGGGASGTEPSSSTAVMVVDPTTGTFRALTPSVATNGARVTVSAPLASGLWIAAEYSTGAAISSETGPDALYAQALGALTSKRSQAAAVQLEGKVAGSGTRMRASYRAQSAKLITAVDPYSDFASGAYLGFLIEQPIRFGTRLPKGLNATIDVTNLLAQGYRPFVSADGQTLYFAQAPRTIQAGLSFTF